MVFFFVLGQARKQNDRKGSRASVLEQGGTLGAKKSDLPNTTIKQKLWGTAFFPDFLIPKGPTY